MDENRVAVTVPNTERMSCPSTATQEAPRERLSMKAVSKKAVDILVLMRTNVLYLYINSGLFLTHPGGHSGDWASIPKALTF